MSLGTSSASVKRYLQSAEQNTVTDHKVAIPVMERPAKTNSEPCQSPCSTSSQVISSVSSVEKDSIEQPPRNGNMQSTSAIPTQEPTEQYNIIQYHLHTKAHQNSSLRRLDLIIRIRSVRPYMRPPMNYLIDIMLER